MFSVAARCPAVCISRIYLSLCLSLCLSLVIAVPVLWTGSALAADNPADNARDNTSGETLTLAQATQLALARNPVLVMTGYSLKVSESQVTQASLRPNPQLSLEFEDFLGSGSMRGVKSLQTTLALSQVIELGNQRKLRIGSARAGVDVENINQQAAQLDVLADVTRRFIDVVAAQEAMRLADSMVALSQSGFDVVDARVQAARSPEAERGRAHIALLRARLDQQHASSVLQGARQLLAATWGGTQATFTQASADLFNFPELDSYAVLLQRLDGNPGFTRFANQSRLRDAEVRLAQAQARPNLSVSVGMRRLEATGDMALVAGVSMPLRVSDRNQGNIQAAEYRRAQTLAEEHAARIQAQATLFNLYQQITTLRDRVKVLREAAIPQSQQVLQQVQYGYERGRFSYLELLAAQSELLELQSAAIDAAADSQRLLAEIERLTSEPLAHLP